MYQTSHPRPPASLWRASRPPKFGGKQDAEEGYSFFHSSLFTLHSSLFTFHSSFLAPPASLWRASRPPKFAGKQDAEEGDSFFHSSLFTLHISLFLPRPPASLWRASRPPKFGGRGVDEPISHTLNLETSDCIEVRPHSFAQCLRLPYLFPPSVFLVADFHVAQQF